MTTIARTANSSTTSSESFVGAAALMIGLASQPSWLIPPQPPTPAVEQSANTRTAEPERLVLVSGDYPEWAPLTSVHVPVELAGTRDADWTLEHDEIAF
jgi:hypothetical protein